MAVAENTGAHLFVERLRFEWRPGTPLPEPSTRLAFRAVRDTDEIIDLMTRVLDGTLVTPARNDYNPIIGYLAVLPEHRGNGYIDDVLSESTHILAAHDVPRIRAATDLGNTPMAAAFHRAGYVNVERTIIMTWH